MPYFVIHPSPGPAGAPSASTIEDSTATTTAAHKASRYAHAKQFKRMRRELRQIGRAHV